MNRFDALCQAGNLRYKALEDAKVERLLLVRKLMKALADYVGFPRGRMCFAELSPDFKAGAVLGEVRDLADPNFRKDDDYFRFSVVMELRSHEKIGKWMRIEPVFGIKKKGSSSFAVRCGKDVTEFLVQTNDDKSIEGFCESVYTDLLEFLRSPIETPNRRFGFPSPIDD